MPTSEAVYEPMNGKEIRQVLKRQINKIIDDTPNMKEGHAFHQATLAFSFTMTCEPADVPTPSIDCEVAAKSPEFDRQTDYLDAQDKITTLKEKRIKLEEGIKKIDTLLDVLQPVNESEVVIEAGNVPDKVRADNDLPLPRIVTSTTVDGQMKKSGVYQTVEEITTGKSATK